MQCVWRLVVALGAIVVLCDAQGCGAGGTCGTGLAYKKHFDELGCKATGKLDANCCSSSYDTSSLSTRSSTQCTYMGTTYAVGATLPPAIQSLTPCLSNCVCNAATMPGGAPSWSCVKQTCPALTLNSSCSAVMDRASCCPTGIACGKALPTAYTCKVGPQFIRENSVIPTADPCMNCLCMKGFNGAVSAPFCVKVNCGIELTDYESNMKRGCAPVYSNGNPPSCCPVSWQCPNPITDKIVSASRNNNMPPINNAISCSFGRLTLKDAESILTYNEDGSCVQCVCHITPGLTCTAIAKCPTSAPASAAGSLTNAVLNTTTAVLNTTIAAGNTFLTGVKQPTAGG